MLSVYSVVIAAASPLYHVPAESKKKCCSEYSRESPNW